MEDDNEAADSDAISKIPAMIKASRDDFARLYDAEALKREGDSFTSLKMLVQIERLLDPDAETGIDAVAFGLGFREATRRKWVRDLVRQVVMAQMIAMPDEPDALGPDQTVTLQRIGQLSAPVAGSLTIDLQANGNKEDGYLDPLRLSAEMNLITRRVCQVLVDRVRKGTGFLVGAQVVLTNWHVVRDFFPDGRDGPIARITDNRLKVVFDQFKVPVAGAEPALADGGKSHFVIGIDASDAAYLQEYSGEAIDITHEPWIGDSEKLDFALLRLDGLPGNERGWYTLAKDIWPRAGASIYLAQFPDQYALKVANGTFGQLCDNNVRRRVRHRANSAGGSSGGLCLSFDAQTSTLKPSALHQASVTVAATDAAAGQKTMLNQAIPLAKIAPLIERWSRQADAVSSILRLGAASGQDHVGAPVLGRGTFQKHVAEAISGEARILIVRPQVPPGQSASGIGKSFSEVLLRSILPPDAHIIASFNARDIPTDASACAQAIVDRVAGKPLGETWSNSESAANTETAWINGTLMNEEFSPRLKSAARGRMVWLVIDDLDQVPLPDAGGRRFLDALYQRVEALQVLRIVLIGLKPDLPSYDPQQVRIDHLERPPGETEVLEWLTRRFGTERAVDPDLQRSFCTLAMGAAAEPGAAALARAIKDRIDSSLPPEHRSLEERTP